MTFGGQRVYKTFRFFFGLGLFVGAFASPSLIGEGNMWGVALAIVLMCVALMCCDTSMHVPTTGGG